MGRNLGNWTGGFKILSKTLMLMLIGAGMPGLTQGDVISIEG